MASGLLPARRRMRGRTAGDPAASSVVSRLRRDVANYSLSRLPPAFLGVVTLPIVAGPLRPAEFGLYSLAATTMTYVGAMCGDPFVLGYQRGAHRADAREARLALGWTSLSGLSGSAVLLVTGTLAGREELLLAAGLVVPFVVIRLLLADLQMRGRSGAYSAVQGVYSAGKAGGVLVGAMWLRSAAGCVTIWCAAGLFTVVLLRPPRPALRAPELRVTLDRWLVVGVPLALNALLVNPLASMDKFVVAADLGKEATGTYSFAYGLAEGAMTVLASLIYLAVYPLAAGAWDRGDVRQAGDLLAAAILAEAGVLGGGICGACLLLPVLDPAGPLRVYGPALALIPAIAAGVMLFCLGQLLMLRPALRRRSSSAAVVAVATVAVNVAGNAALIPPLGVKGAACAAVLTYGVYALALGALYWRRPRVWLALGYGLGTALMTTFPLVSDGHTGLRPGLAGVGLGLAVGLVWWGVAAVRNIPVACRPTP